MCALCWAANKQCLSKERLLEVRVNAQPSNRLRCVRLSSQHHHALLSGKCPFSAAAAAAAQGLLISYTHAHTHPHTHAHTHAHAHMHTHTHAHTHAHAHMHTHTHTHAHTHTHTRFILTLACCSIRDKAWSLSSWASCCSPCSVHISSACCLRAASTCACSCAFTACSCASASCAAQMGIGYKVIEAAAMHESVS